MSLRRNALWLVLASALLAIVGDWSGEAALAGAWALPALALLLGIAWERWFLRRGAVSLELRTPQRWPLGRPNAVQLVFRQSSGRSVPVQVVLAAPEEFAAAPRIVTLQLASGIPTATAFEAAARRLGRYAWPPTRMRIGGALGLAWWSQAAAAPCTVTVVPDLGTVAGNWPAHQPQGLQRGRAPGGGAEILQLREYRAGDPLRTVDWKATARRGRLISRDFSADQHLEVLVAIDAGRASGLGAGDVDRLGLYVNVAARLAQRALDLEDAVGVLVFAAQPLTLLAPARGAAAFGRIQHLLGACRVQASESNPVMAAARLRAALQRRSLVIFLTDLEDASAGEQLTRAVRLLTPKHLPFIAALTSERIVALPQAEVREPFGAYRSLAALEYLATVDANVRALHALGAAAVTARPKHLDGAVLTAYRDFRDRRRI